MADHIQDPLIAQMGHVGNDPQALHLLQEFKALFRKSLFCFRHEGILSRPQIFIPVGVRQLVGEIPGEGEHTDAQLVKDPEIFQLSLADGSLLHRKESGHTSLCHVFFNVPEASYDPDPVRISAELCEKRIDETERILRKGHFPLKVLHMGEYGKVLYRIIPPLHFLQVDVQVVF